SSYKMVIPESVKEIGERAFANSENLKTLTLNKNITLIADNSFENCSSLELEFPLNYVCLEHVFKKNIPYKLIIGEHKMNAGILNEKSSRFKVDGITPEGYYNCSIQYEVDSNKFAALKNKMIRMRLDNNTRMVYSSIKMNGQKLTNISMIDHLLSIPVTENHGTISFLLKPFNGIQAKAFASFSYSDSDKKMDDLIGYISSSEAGITCETPSFTSEKTFEIQGYSKADAVVKIFIDEKLQGEVKTDHKGFYKYSLHHNFNTFGSHTIKVNLNETNKWVLKKVVFDPNHPELEKFEMIYSNHHLEAGNDYHSVDLLKNDISYVTAWYNRPLTFKIKYKNDKNIGAVFLNGYIEGKKAMIQMFKDKKTGEWVNKYPFVPSDPLKLPSSIWPTVIRKDQLKTENDDKIDLDLKKNEKLDKSVARMSKNYFSETLKIKKDDIKPGFSRKIDKNKTSSSLLALAQTYDKLISSSEVEYDSILAEYKHSLASYIKSSVSKFKKMNGITIEKNPNIEVVSNIAMNMLSIGLGELNADLGFVFDTITNTIDVYTCYYYMFRVLAAIENNNKADLKKYGNLLIRKSLVASFNIYSLFNPTQGLANAITMGLFSFALEKILDGIDFATGIEFLVNLPKIIRDPSGYVYEAVTSNRIEGAVVSIYHQDLVNGTPVFWESAKFGQENNQITKADGKYGWNVPEGNWQVRCQKPGYENYTSGWIKVPPQHDDINIGLISKETPTLSNGIRKDDGIELNFSKYMKPDSVKNMVINDEKGEVFAKKYILKIKNKGKVAYSLKTNGKIKSYAGISMDEKTMVLK
ncbi:leucine-rich repeat protein, partial [Bulleidia extructa]